MNNHGVTHGDLIYDVGKTGMSVRLDGINDYVSIANNESLNLTDGTTGKVYIDGLLDGEGPVGIVPSNALDIFVGRAHPFSYAGIAEWFKGLIDEVRIYNRALSSTEIQQLYHYELSR